MFGNQYRPAGPPPPRSGENTLGRATNVPAHDPESTQTISRATAEAAFQMSFGETNVPQYQDPGPQVIDSGVMPPQRMPTTYRNDGYGAPIQAPAQQGPAPRGGSTPLPSQPHRPEVVTRRRRPRAPRGWRRLTAILTGGLINPGLSAKQEADAQLLASLATPLVDVFKVAFLDIKGGVGKTTMTAAVGSTIAHERGDRVIACDVNDDFGDLATRFSDPGGPEANIEHLAAMKNIERYSNVRVHTVQNKDRLEALASQDNPRSSYVLGPRDYKATMTILETHYNVVLLDCGTSITAPLFSTIANDVGAVVIVAAQNTRGIAGARTSLEWLAAHGFSRLLPRTVVIFNATSPGKPFVDLEAEQRWFEEKGTTVLYVPYDRHLAEGMAIELDELKSKTRKALIAVAGAVAKFYPARLVPDHNNYGGEY